MADGNPVSALYPQPPGARAASTTSADGVSASDPMSMIKTIASLKLLFPQELRDMLKHAGVVPDSAIGTMFGMHPADPSPYTSDVPSVPPPTAAPAPVVDVAPLAPPSDMAIPGSAPILGYGSFSN